MTRTLRIAVLFDGAGLARLGLEQAGHACTGYELDPAKHHLSRMVGSGNCVLADVRTVDLSGYDAVWASPPCQQRSSARTQGEATGEYAVDLLEWALALPHDILWVENVRVQGSDNGWGTPYNAAQFEIAPRQNRPRVIGGRYRQPLTFRSYRADEPGICNTITATEWKGCASDKRRASRWYGRRLSVREAAWHQGFDIPDTLLRSWFHVPDLPNPAKGRRYTETEWRNNLYQAIGNGVPVYMARAFGEAYTQPHEQVIQQALFAA